MSTIRVAAVQAAYVLMDRGATLDRVAELTAGAAQQGAQLLVFPEVFVPGTPIWIDTQTIWNGDEDWFRMLAENALIVPSPATERLGAIARQHEVWLLVGVEERERKGGTIHNRHRQSGRSSFVRPGLLAAPERRCYATSMAGGSRRRRCAFRQ